MNTFVRLIPVLFACVATQVVAGDPPTPKTAEPDKTAQAKPDPGTTPPAAAKPERLVLEDKTLTNAEVSQLLAQGYRPQKGRGDDVLYCRSEQPLGTRFAQKVCKTADQIKAQMRDSKDMAARQQMPSGNPAGK